MEPTIARLRVPHDVWHKTLAHVFPGDGNEHLAFLIAGSAAYGTRCEFLAYDVVLINDDDLVGGPRTDSVELKTAALVTVVNRAIAEGAVLIEVHCHPLDSGTCRFSLADEGGFSETVPYVLSSLPSSKYAAVVLSDGGVFDGRAWLRCPTKFVPIDKVAIVGPDAPLSGDCSPTQTGKLVRSTADSATRYDRQVRAIGVDGQRALGKIRVAIVGLGGLGSVLAELLSRIGIADFVLVDFDTADPTSENRVLGMSAADALCAVPKIAIAARNILRANPQAAVRPIPLSVFHASAIQALSDVDIIIGCTDDVATRFAINDISLAYLRPYLDLATEIEAPQRVIRSIGGRYTFCFPGTGCLLCGQAIDAHEAAAEFTPNVIRAAQRRHGYVTGSDEHAPAVMPLNSAVASLAAHELLMWASGLRRPTQQAIFDGLRTNLTRVSFSSSPSCDRCASLLGRGDGAAVQSRYRPWAAAG